MTLPPRQRECLQFICSFIELNGYSPTVREIGEAMNGINPNGVMCHLLPLREKGFIDWADGKSRTIRVLKQDVPVAVTGLDSAGEHDASQRG